MSKYSAGDTWLGAFGVLIALALGCAALTAYIALTYKLCMWVWKFIV